MSIKTADHYHAAEQAEQLESMFKKLQRPFDCRKEVARNLLHAEQCGDAQVAQMFLLRALVFALFGRK